MFMALAFVLVSHLQAQPPVTALAFQPDGKRCFVGSQSGIAILSWPELKPTDSLDTKCSHVEAMAFSPNDRFLAVVGGKPGEQGRAEIWDWKTKKLAYEIAAAEDALLDVSWNAQSDTILCGSADSSAILIGISEKRFIIPLKGHSRPVTSVAWLRSSNTLITGSNDHSLLVIKGDSKSKQRTLNNHTDTIESVAARPGSWPGPEMIVSASSDKTIRLWQPTIGRMVRFVRFDVVPLDVGWTTSGDAIVVSCTDGRIRVIDPATVEIQEELPAVNGWAYSLAIHPNDGTVAVGGPKGQVVPIKIKH
jgi:WD40 repeat protein